MTVLHDNGVILARGVVCGLCAVLVADDDEGVLGLKRWTLGYACVPRCH